MKNAPLLLVLLGSCIIYSCTKSNSNNPANPNTPNNTNTTDTVNHSQKQINSVVFSFASNPALGYDISSVVGSDTIKCLFAPNTTINNLVPDISFLGKSISPASKTARDFTRPVTYTVTAEDGTTKQYVFSCSVAADSAAMLVGKWTLLKDSSTNNNFVTTDGVYMIPGVYIGQPGDYFEYTSNGIFNMHANNQTGTGFKYHIVPNARLYEDFISPYLDDGYILELTPNKAIIYWTKTSAAGGKYFRMDWLKR